MHLPQYTSTCLPVPPEYEDGRPSLDHTGSVGLRPLAWPGRLGSAGGAGRGGDVGGGDGGDGGTAGGVGPAPHHPHHSPVSALRPSAVRREGGERGGTPESVSTPSPERRPAALSSV